MTTIGVFLGSIRQGRVGEGVAHWVTDTGNAREGVEYRLLDLADFNVPALTAAFRKRRSVIRTQGFTEQPKPLLTDAHQLPRTNAHPRATPH